MSDDSCIQCTNQVRPRQEALQCEKCQRWQHRTCNTGVNREQYRQAVKNSENLDWTCQQCQEEVAEAENPSIIIDRPFVVPEPVVEDSIIDEPVLDIEPDHNASKVYHLVDQGSNRGKRKLIDSDGFSYTVKKQKNDHTLWRCIKRSKNLNCPATIIQDGDTYKQGSKNHLHPGEPGSHVAVKIRTEVKQKSKESTYGKPTSSIVQSVMREHADHTLPPASRPNPSYLVRTGNRIRQGDRPQDPVDLDSELDLDFLHTKTPEFLRRDLVVGDRRHLIFYTDRQLDLLARAKVWYMDGTFRVVNDPWKQLFSIHAFIKSGNTMKQIPLVYCIMSGKRQEDYYEVLRFIDRRLPDQISLTGFVADFEAGLWQALRQRFPDIAIQGCAFHWSQAVFRKVQEHGLQTAYNQRDDTYRFLRQLMALPFLPAEHIPDAFHQLDQRAPPAIQPIMDYVYNTWINNSVFEVHHWTIFMTSVRTNNDVEGWHNRFNSNFASRGPVPFYHLITELYSETLDIPLQLKLVSEGKLSRYQRKKTREVQGKVFTFWHQYIDRVLSASQLLKECAYVYGPPTQ